jgi:NAD(P)-dependent dehydrogenase (short-subunit alcohol dehydrogenase family)
MPGPNDHIFILGGTSGLGLSVARSAAALGCRVTIAGRGHERAAEIAKSIGPTVTGVEVDLEDSGSIHAAMATGDPIDHLVITPVSAGEISIKAFNVADATRFVRVKILGYAEVVSEALPRLKPTSSIVLFGGAAKARPYPGGTMVSTANGAIVAMTRTLAVELAPIRVNGISPGLVRDSPRWERRISQGAGPMVDAVAARTPGRRLPMTEDIVHAVFFLTDNRAVNGIDLEIDAGGLLV